MSQNNVSSVILKFTLDESSQRRVLKGVGDIEQVLTKTQKRLVSVEDAAAGLNAEFAELARAKAIDNLSADAIKAASETGDWARELERVSTLLSEIGASDSEIQQVARSLANANASGGGRVGGSRTGAGGVETVDRLGSVGSQLLSGLGQGELANVAGIVGDVAGGVGALGIAGVAAAGALAAVSVGMSEYNRQLDQQKNALKGALDAQNRYYQALGSFTTEQAAQEIETETARLANLRQQRAETQAALDNAFRQAQATFTDPLARALDAGGQLPTAQLRDQLKELDAGIASTEGYVARLSDGIRNLAFASQDTLSDVEAALAQREKFQQIQTRVQLNEVQLQVRANQMTSDAREKRRAEIEAEISVLEQSASSTELTWQAQSELNAQITALRTESEILRRTFSSAADAAAELAARTETIKKQTDNYFDAVTATTKAQEDLAKAQQDAQTVHDKYIADTLEISRKADEQYQQIVADSGDKRADIVQKSEDQIAKIQRDAGRDLFNAVAERDALAALKAKEGANDELADAKKAQADQVKELEKGQAKQIESLRRSVDQQVRTRDTQYRNEAAQAANAALQAQITLQNRAYAEQAIAANGANGMRSIVSNMWGQLTIETVNGVNAILTATRQLVGRSGFTGTTFGGTNAYVNGVNPGSPAAYDLVGLPPPQTTAVNRAVDQRLGTYFNMAGYSR